MVIWLRMMTSAASVHTGLIVTKRQQQMQANGKTMFRPPILAILAIAVATAPLTPVSARMQVRNAAKAYTADAPGVPAYIPKRRGGPRNPCRTFDDNHGHVRTVCD